MIGPVPGTVLDHNTKKKKCASFLVTKKYIYEWKNKSETK